MKATVGMEVLALINLHVNPASLPGVYRALEPPDPIPNSEVKRCIADGSVGLPHVRVGQRQAPNRKAPFTVL